MFKQMQKKALDQVLRISGTMSAPPDKRIEREPIEPTQLGKRGF
jgi:hypothetical protein